MFRIFCECVPKLIWKMMSPIKISTLSALLVLLVCVSVIFRYNVHQSNLVVKNEKDIVETYIGDNNEQLDYDFRMLRGESTDDGEKSNFHFKKPLELINNIANLIYQRFEFHHKQRFQFFLGSSNMPAYAWDLIKYKIAKKILLRQNETYLMIFGGSSVTAGHDNYYHQAYPFVVERRMKDIFDALGMHLVVHNIAQGSNNCRPSNYCYGGMGGENADFIGWEQSFNCGRAKDIMEYIARVAYWSGAVVYYSASGAFLTTGCAPTKDTLPWTAEEWTPEKADITSTPYSLDLNTTQTYRDLLNAWYDDGNSVSRFTNQVYGGLYKGVGPHGYSVWGHSGHLCNDGKGCNAIDEKGPCYEQGGSHWMIAETSYYAGEKGKFGKSWHPPAGMHLMRGEIIVYNYLHILADTIYMIDQDLQSMSLTDAIEKYEKAWEELRTPIPESKGIHLSEGESHSPAKCYTNFRPHFMPKYLLSSLVLKDSIEHWKYIDIPSHHTPEEKKYGYADDRPYYESTTPGALIHIRLDIPINSTSEIRICGYAHTDSLKHALFYLDQHVMDTIPHDSTTDWKYTPSSKRYLLTNRKYAGDECTLVKEIPVGGSHVLTVETSPKEANHRSTITHVIIF